MDRSFLSDRAVVEASRSFVCARLLTFEDVEEAALMSRLLPGRDPVNTVFTILDPSGREPLVRPGRSPRRRYASGAELAADMKRLAARYPGEEQVRPDQLGLPLLTDVRRALNVTECDAQQLVVLRGSDAALQPLLDELVRCCWSAELIGRFLYVRADDATDWDTIAGAGDAPAIGLLLVQTDRYGLTGRVVGAAEPGISAPRLQALLRDAAAAFSPAPVDTRKRRRQGRRAGVRWEAEVSPRKGG